MIDGQHGLLGTTLGTCPIVEIASLDPRQRLPRRVTRSAQCDGLDPPQRQVVLDARQLAVDGVEHLGKIVPERCRIDQAPHANGTTHPTREKLEKPAHPHPTQGRCVYPKHFLYGQALP